MGEKGSSHGTVNAEHTAPRPDELTAEKQNAAGSLLGLAYESSDEE